MKKFCTDLRKRQTEITNYEKEKMLPLTDEKNKSWKNTKFCHICKNKFHNTNDKCDDSDSDGSNDNSNVDEEFDAIKFNNAGGLDDADDDYCDHDNNNDDDLMPEYFMMVTQDLMMNTS